MPKSSWWVPTYDLNVFWSWATLDWERTIPRTEWPASRKSGEDVLGNIAVGAGEEDSVGRHDCMEVLAMLCCVCM